MAQAEGVDGNGGRGLRRLYEAAAEKGVDEIVRREFSQEIEIPLKEGQKIVGGQTMRRILREKKKKEGGGEDKGEESRGSGVKGK